ncbi:hypothetical protein [Streptomyces sp. NPDC086777]
MPDGPAPAHDVDRGQKDPLVAVTRLLNASLWWASAHPATPDSGAARRA